MIKLSIITVNLNNKEGLEKTIESILLQTNRNFEHIVIDGKSVDGSLDVLLKYQTQLKFVSEKDDGIYDAMNKGIKLAKGEYLQFLNSGDFLFEATTLEKVLPQLLGQDIAYGNLKIDELGHLRDGFMPNEISLDQMMNDTLWHPVAFIRRQLFERVGLYNTNYKIVADYDFFFNAIIMHKASTQHLNEFIAVFNTLGLSSDIKNVLIIKSEKQQVQSTYLCEAEIADFKNKSNRQNSVLKNLFSKWFR